MPDDWQSTAYIKETEPQRHSTERGNMISIRQLMTALFAYPVDGIEPRLVQLERPIKLAGMSVETNLKNIYRDVPPARLSLQPGRDYRRF